MQFKHLLITGGAGFVGANLALNFRRHYPDLKVTAFDNLKRRGGELNLPRLKSAGVEFVHGDVRSPADLAELPPFDLFLDCAAEPSVQAGLHGSPTGVLETNLVGSLHSFEAARRHGAAILLLSTSRVYPIASLNGLPFEETATRFRWTDSGNVAGFSDAGIAENFSTDGPRSYYGASKLASELVLQEYAANHGVPALINRCGILTGPWQMGKVDQGVTALWVARHYFGVGLRYTGYGGTGKQVRDMLHVDDLFELLVKQIGNAGDWRGQVYNVGGGNEVSTSLCELTEICRRATGKTIPIANVPETSPVDLRIYITDARRVRNHYGWKPTRDVPRIVEDIRTWIAANEAQLRPMFAG
jgi:CDP-paratose 2-epimerase